MKNKVLVFCLLIFLTACAGCGNYVGGGGSKPVYSNEEDKYFYLYRGLQEHSLDNNKEPGALQEITMPEAGDICLRFAPPADAKDEELRYSIVIYNSGSTTKKCGVCPKDFSLETEKAPNDYPHLLHFAVRGARPNMRHSNAFLRRQAVRSEIQRRSLKRFLTRSKLGGSFREIKTDHRNEKVGDIVNISILADSGAHEHAPRRFKLEKITKHCKLFVDQDPYDYKGEPLSAVADPQGSNSYAITEKDLDHFADEFEKYIYPLMKEGYGDWFDIDQDGRISYLFSPIYTYFEFAGLFDSFGLQPEWQPSGPEDEKRSPEAIRDYVGIFSPGSGSSGEKWLVDARETMAHELQHAILFSSRIYPGGYLRGDLDERYVSDLYEEVWLDESLAVGAEARYRLKRHEAGELDQENVSDPRFNVFTCSDYLNKLKITDWALTLEHYGQKGLFNFYLFSAYGPEKIKELVHGGGNGEFLIGEDNIKNVYGFSVASLSVDFSTALLNEAIMCANPAERDAIAGRLEQKYKFAEDTGISFYCQNVDFDQFAEPVAVSPGASAYFCVTRPKDYIGPHTLRIRTLSVPNTVSSEGDGVLIRVMRLK